MAFVKITDLPLLTYYPSIVSALTAGDVIPLVHGPTTYKVELSTLQQYFTQSQNVTAAGNDYQVQFSLHGKLCADAGFVYFPTISSLQVGNNNLVTGINSAILGGAFNTNNYNNTFILGSNITSTSDNFTLTNNLSSVGLIAGNVLSGNLVSVGAYDSVDWSSAFVYANSQSARLSMPSLDTRYVNASGDSMTGNLSVGADIFTNNLTVLNNLSVLGSLTYLDTSVSVTSSLSVINFGTSPGLTIQQYGNTPIAVFQDPTGGGFVEITSTGAVGINTPTPNKQLTVVGDISATGSIYGTISADIPSVQNVLYVSTNGNDNNSGRNIYSPLRTIKKACQIVSQNQSLTFPVTPTIGFPANQWTIFVVTGDYTEQNPIYVPGYTSIIGDNLRRVTIRPANPAYDILWLNTACYLWGVTFRDHLYPSAATAFPNLNQSLPTFNIAFNYSGYEIATVLTAGIDYYRTYKPYVITSPYTQGSSSITSSIVAPQQSAVTQSISSISSFGNTSSALVAQEFANFATIVLNGPSANPMTSPQNFANVPADAGVAIAALTANRSTIQNAATAYINANYPTLFFNPNYQYAACYRDSGYIIDCIVADLYTGTNARIVEAANVYYVGTTNLYGTPSAYPLPVYEIFTNIWQYVNNFTLSSYLTNTPVSSAYVRTEFNALTSILSGGQYTVAINTLSTVTPDMIRAANLLSANRSFFQNELTAYVDNNYAGFQYGTISSTAALSAKQKCYRDMGWVIDAIQYDLRTGTNARAITYANSYYVGAPSRIANQQITTAATINFAKYLATFIVGNSAVQTTAAGCGIRVDGSLARGYLRSFVTDSFTQTNQGGYGIHITNNGYAQLVSTFTICCSIGVYADKGGTCSINTSNCSFGLSGLVADGYSSSPVLTGTLVNNIAFNTNIFTVSGITPRYDPPDYNTYAVPITVPYVGLVYKVAGDATNTLYVLTSAGLINSTSNTYNIVSNANTTINFVSGGLVNFYLRSQIATGSHTFEYVGSGTVLSKSVPALGGIANTDNEAVGTNGGAIYFTSTNHLGNFKVGNGFTIVQETGTIEGRTFQRAILSLVTPLTLALE